MAPEFSEIVRRFGERVYQLSFRILGNTEDAREATQDTFMAVRSSLPTFVGDSTISTWIYAIVVRVCERCSRRRDDVTTVEIDEYVPDPSPDPQQVLEERAFSDLLGRLIADLPEQEADVITLFYIEGKSYKQIAEILLIPEGTVCTALHRGREHLRKFLASQERHI